ncbi:MAG: ribose-phosphate pyrophosphokinase [Chloroflexi bacterium]|nr:MAG: ribose-phosphate pyrophosphokinase [Chloroflexota bacterium]
MTLPGPLIFTGNAHPALANAISHSLGIPPGRAEVTAFANENIFVRICENVRERDVFLVQPGARPVNNSFMELLIMIDAVRRASAGRITAVIPYFPYGRSDKKDQPRVPITARLIANLLETAGADRILTMDLHAGQIQGFFNIPTDELTAMRLLGDVIRERGFNGVVVAPDLGSAKRARNMAENLNTGLALCEKRRISNNDHAQVLNLIGDVDGQDTLIIDDEVDTAGTLVEVATLLKERGATAVSAACTHGVLSGPAMERLDRSPLDSLLMTDTLPTQNPASAKIELVSVAPLLGDTIQRIHTGSSVGELFQ